MRSSEVNQQDVDRALSMVDYILSLGCPAEDVRRQVERVLARCAPGSHRYAFWRLILALVIAETGKPTSADRVPMAIAC
jgi:hypothetical protein